MPGKTCRNLKLQLTVAYLELVENLEAFGFTQEQLLPLAKVACRPF
jgi:hypothetical protein